MKRSIVMHYMLMFFFVGTIVPADIPMPPPLPAIQPPAQDTTLLLTAKIRQFFESIISNNTLQHAFPQTTLFVRYVLRNPCTHFSPELNIRDHVRITLFNNQTKLRFFMIPTTEWNHFVQLANQFEENNNQPQTPNVPTPPSNLSPQPQPDKNNSSKKSDDPSDSSNSSQQSQPDKNDPAKQKQEAALKKEEEEKKKKEKEEKEKQPVRYVPQPQNQQPPQQQAASLPSHWQSGRQHHPPYGQQQPSHPQPLQQPRNQGFVPDKIGFEGLFRGDQPKTAKTADATPAEIEALKARGAVNIALPYTDYDQDVEIPAITPEKHTFEHERRSERRSLPKTISAKTQFDNTLATKDITSHKTPKDNQPLISEKTTSWIDRFCSQCSSWWSSLVAKIQSLFS